MEQETDFILYEGVVVPESALRRAERESPYGSVPGLDDEELATPEELERQVMREEWGPVLALPVRGSRGFRPDFVDNEGAEFNAFATVDFARTTPKFNKMRYKADRLREELQNVLMMFDTVKDRLPKAKYKVLKYVVMGLIGLEHIVSDDMLALARLHLRALRLQKEIAGLEKASWDKNRKVLAELLA